MKKRFIVENHLSFSMGSMLRLKARPSRPDFFIIFLLKNKDFSFTKSQKLDIIFIENYARWVM